ncbi:SH3 domain-binding protein 1-like isoform X1 [Penaeus chinensis]|uniref:SH3 domain-binding protein 1-like isoform X1 n=1 Tax=Penaeus chinensis TaxID=139456 RepID=UPI001FB5D9F3|nr:SH3 domain-binding protein 1-like isoform X1 [Penaeus chinensis]
MNFGRQLKRVKQQADHLFLRSDRTDVVGELRTAEEQADELRLLCEAYTRSLEKCLHTHTMPDEKKLRKVPEYQVAEGLRESLNCLPSAENHEHKDLLRIVVERVVEVQQAMGLDVVEFEDQVEKQVLGPLLQLIKEDFPSISKQKKQLKQFGLDLDAAKTRWRNSQANPSQNTKMDLYREELEEAETKLDQARDSYACDIFGLLSREREVSQYMCGYLELQREFLQNTLDKLDRVLPEMKSQLHASSSSPVYGVPLHDHLKITQEEIAVPLQVCVRRLIEVGLYEEGVFRVAGSASKVRRLKGAFDANLVTNEALAQADEHDRDYDVHVVAGALKCYLRELPEPLLTHVKHDQWLEAVRNPDHQHRLRALWVVVNQIPPANLANLRYLIKFLAILAANANSNKMSPSNIAIVIAPNLIWAQRDSEEQPDLSTLGRNMSLTSDYRSIVEHLVEYSDYFFKENVDFGVTPRVPPSPSRTHAAPNGTLPAPARQAAQTHRRNASSDLSGRIDVVTGGAQGVSASGECESPKQPQRTKKKQAPRPPQVRPVSTHGPLVNDGQSPPSVTSTTTSASASPEQVRSNTPPREAGAPAPAARLHHSNSIRRPTAEPPKPPTAPAKPPRPSPPAADALERSVHAQSEVKTESKGVVLGFEQISQRDVDVVDDEDEVVLRKDVVNEGPAPIGFLVEGEIKKEEGDASPKSVRSFRQSLENVIQQQAAGQPVALPRHTPSAGEGESAPAPGVLPLPRVSSGGDNQRPVLPPTPAQRTTLHTVTPAVNPQRVTKENNQTERSEPPRVDKPALPEKPSLMSRSTVIVDHSKPQIPERPVVLPQRPNSTGSGPHIQAPVLDLVSSSAAQQEASGTLVMAVEDGDNTSHNTNDDCARDDGGGTHSDITGAGAVLEKAHMYSVDKQQVSIVQVGVTSPAQVRGAGSGFGVQKPVKPPKPDKRPQILPRPPALSSDHQDTFVSQSSSVAGVKSNKFSWPPPSESAASTPSEEEEVAPDSTNL